LPTAQTHRFICPIGTALMIVPGGSKVQLIDVFSQHAVRAELRSELSHTGPHACYPGGGNAAAITFIEARNNLIFEEMVGLFRFPGILVRVITMLLPIADSPANLGPESFRPPTIPLR
jgi:hypothetical protein